MSPTACLSPRSGPAPAAVLVVALLLLTARLVAAEGFVGESRCANPTCHGASLPASPGEDPHWRPWQSARTQWLNFNVDRHSRAYRTLTNEDSKRIAGSMGIEATKSEKCLRCHAPDAPLAAGSKHQPRDGVSCEHCHGPAEAWLEPHKARDWPQQRTQFVARGLYDNNDFRLRAEKCASCHVEIDHEIVAGGHPPLQFEMVAYALVMKHWDDQDELSPGSFSVDPSLWAIGQLVGLRHAAQAVAHRAGGANYQSLDSFSHFQEQNCYQCHHKLVDDALRQTQGHVEMADAALAALAPDARGPLTAQWNALRSAVPASAAGAEAQAKQLETLANQLAERLDAQRASQAQAKAMLCTLLKGGPTVGQLRKFSFARPERSNVLRVTEIGLPWWYTTGAREQIALGFQALCGPAFGDARCAAALPQLKTLVAAANRADSDPAQFLAALQSIRSGLCG